MSEEVGVRIQASTIDTNIPPSQADNRLKVTGPGHSPRDSWIRPLPASSTYPVLRSRDILQDPLELISASSRRIDSWQSKSIAQLSNEPKEGIVDNETKGIGNRL